KISAIFSLDTRVAIDVVQEFLQLIQPHEAIPRLGCGPSGTPVRDGMRAEAHPHVLRLERHLVTPGPALPAHAGGLGAAEGLARVSHVLAVDETHAGLDGRCDAVRATESLAPDIAAQAVLDIVGLGKGVGLA